MKPAVVDASVLVDALIPVPQRAAAFEAMRSRELYAPSIVDFEVASALGRLERAGAISTAEADTAIADLTRVRIERMPSDALLPTAWALRHSIRLSDALYVAAARLLDADLITSDARRARAPQLGVAVTVLPR